MKKNILLFFLLFCYSFSFAETLTKTDSLKLRYFSEKNDALKLRYAIEFLEFIKYQEPEYVISTVDSLVQFRANSFKTKATLYTIAGASAWHLGDLNKSTDLFKQALINYSKDNDEIEVASSYNNIGYNFFEMGNYTAALQSLQQAYNIAKKHNDADILSVTNTYIGQVNVKLKNYTQAAMAYRQSIQIFEKSREYENLAIVYNNLGNIFLEQNSFDSAEFWFNRSYQLSTDSNYVKGIALAASNLGLAYLDQKEYANASKYLNEAYLKFVFLQSDIALVDVSTNLIRLYTETNQITKAVDVFNKIEKIARDVASNNQLFSFYKSSAQLFSEKKEYEKAFVYSQLQLQYADSLSNENGQRIQNEMAFKFETENLHNKIELLTSTNKLKDVEIENKKNQRNFFILIVVTSILSILLLVYVLRAKSKTQKLLQQKNALIEQSLSERETLLKEIHHRVKNNLQIVSSLLNLQHGYASGKGAEELLKVSESRIQSMALIHEQLYKNNNFKEIDLEEYVNGFIQNVVQSYIANESAIKIESKVDKVAIDIDQLVPFGLILHEIIVNCIKHAFTDKMTNAPLIEINISVNDKILTANVTDNGKGLPANFSFDQTKSLGLRLIKGLTNQLKGSIKAFNTEKGACFEFYFKFVSAK